MLNEKLLMNANEFFVDEDENLKKELRVEKMLVDIACKFIKYRADRELSQKQLAEKLGVSQTMVSKLESGDYNPTVKFLLAIALKLEWSFKLELDTQIVTVDYQYINEVIKSKPSESKYELRKMAYAA